MELALRLVTASILAVFPPFLGGCVFSKELLEAYRSNCDDFRAPMSSRRFVAAL